MEELRVRYPVQLRTVYYLPPTYAHFLALINILDIIACTCTLHVPPV